MFWIPNIEFDEHLDFRYTIIIAKFCWNFQHKVVCLDWINF